MNAPMCFPSLKTHHDIEFTRNLLLNQLHNAFLYFHESDLLEKILNEFLKFPGMDPTKDAPIIMYRWSVRCYLYKISPPIVNPSVPLDFSYIHPELSNTEIMYNYAVNSAEDILRLISTFPYEFFKVVSRMRPPDATDFVVALSFNPQIPIHLIGRIISIFPLSSVSIDFSLLYEKRCQSYEFLSIFFEGLLCNESNQITSAQFLANHFDDILNGESLQLLNSTIRSLEHFLDKNMALSTHLFPQCITLSFLLQIETAPLSSLAKAVKRLPPSQYVTRFQNQISIMQITGLGENWRELEQKSVPFLLKSNLYPEILNDMPRDSLFLTLPSYCWKNDFDFIHSFFLICGFMAEKKISFFPQRIYIDIFSLLFLKDIKRKEIRRSSSLSCLIDIKTSSIPKSGSLDYISHDTSDFIFSAETAKNIITIFLNSSKIPEELKPFLERAIIRIKNALILFERPILENVLLPIPSFYAKSLSSIDFIDRSIKSFGNPPNFVLSKKFSLLVSKKMGFKDANGYINFFAGRISSTSKDCSLNQRTEKMIEEVLEEFPKELHSLLLLDFASTHKNFTSLSRKNADPNYTSFVSSLLQNSPRYPSAVVLDFNKPRTLIDMQKRLCNIISCNLKDSILTGWCAFLLMLTTVPSQTYHKFLTVKPELQLLDVINNAESMNEAIERFADTGVDVLQIIFSLNKPKILKEKLLNDIIKIDPLSGIPFAINVMNNKDISEVIDKTSFARVKKYFEKDLFQTQEEKVDIASKLKMLRNVDIKTATAIFDELLYKYDLSAFFDEILSIIKNFPKEWCIEFVDTFISMIDSDNFALIPLQQRLSELKPLPEFSHTTEFEGVCANWEYLMKMITKYDNILNNPEKFYRLCSFHLKRHMIGQSLIQNVQMFTLLLLYVRNYHIFPNRDSEKVWISHYLKNGISNLTEQILSEMIIDIGLTLSYECGFDLAHRCPSLNFSEVIIKKLPKSVKLIPYVSEKDKIIEEILMSRNVKGRKSEMEVLHLLAKIRPFASKMPLFNILYEFTHYSVCLRRKYEYSGSSLVSLRDVALFCDLNNLDGIFDSLLISPSNEVKEKMDNDRAIFGLIEKRSVSINNKLMFTSPHIPFPIDQSVKDAMSQRSKSKLPTLYSITADINSISFIIEPLQKKEIKRFCSPDFKFFDLSYKPSAVRITDNLQNAMTESLAFAEIKNKTNGAEREIDGKYHNFETEEKLEKRIYKSIISSSTFELFDTLSNKDLQSILEYANSKSLLNFLLQLTIWTLGHHDAFQIFVFPGSYFESFDTISNQQFGKLFDFLIALKQTLIIATRLTGEIDASILFPPTIIKSGVRRTLDDMCLVYEHQLQIGVKQLSLFDTNANIANTIAQLFVRGDYNRGFALTRILHADIDEVLIESAALVVQNSEMQLGRFLFSVVPKIDVESSNQLIEAVSSIMVRSKKNEPFLKLLVSGINDHQNVHQMLRWFGFGETAASVAMMEGLAEEVEISMKDAAKKGLSHILRGCKRWNLQHKQIL